MLIAITLNLFLLVMGGLCAFATIGFWNDGDLFGTVLCGLASATLFAGTFIVTNALLK